MVQFGKQIQSQQIPGWGAYYLDYKALKKVISSLAASQTPQGPLGSAIRPNDLFNVPQPSISTETTNQVPVAEPAVEIPAGFSIDNLSLFPGQDHDPPGAGSVFHAHKAAFFFKLERELEKINSFYLLKEADLKLRLATLLSKRKAAAQRLGGRDLNDAGGIEWRTVDEGFRLLERDLTKLQSFIELNATGFRKILKKWDKRSKSRTKELYLARQVEVQPVFNRELIAELSDTVAACLLDLTNVATEDIPVQASFGSGDITLTQHLALSRAAHSSTTVDLEGNLNKAITTPEVSESHILQLLSLAREAATQSDRSHIVRILWKAAIEAPRNVADVIVASPAFDIETIDDISGRTFLHEAAISGRLWLVQLALSRGVVPAKLDVYARSALHYAALKGHSDVCHALLDAGSPSDALDLDNFSPLVHATVNGHLECCRTLLIDGHVNPMSAQAGQDLAPLALACQHGHKEIVLLLLAHGAISQPNSNGELPLHLAAHEGHDEICALLLSGSLQDIPDKYNEWTPLFHAARYGNLECVRLLLEAGHNPTAVDDVGRQPIYYAAWFGHMDCVQILAQAVQLPRGGPPSAKKAVSISPASDLDAPLDFDLDAEPIPTLSLPPPIMPFRVYGHNYLDQNHLVQIALGCPWSSHDNNVLHPVAGVQLIPRLQGLSSKALPQSNPSLKLVATSNFSITDPSFNVVLPLSDDQEMFSFQVQELNNLTLELSVYPSFGSKAIGRAVALSHSFNELQGTGKIILPILDHRLHLIGQVAFDTLNTVVDSVLRTVYASVYPDQREDSPLSKRKLVLTSFSPSICTALNWKQPNYPVFFSSYCGIVPRESHDAEASIETVVGDLRQGSISGAVDFAKENNLLGILVDARLIHQVPSVVLAVRDANILLGSFGSPDQVTASFPAGPDTEPLNLDATLTQGMLTVHEHFSSVQQL
ncbi:hypothetical protein FRC07_008299 [Ceratobasidium sp. 392]|nr:hypothetical protein FRC07_008299 [Ceratobasidium sp. 392]